MAKNMQPVLKRCRTLGVSPAAMGYNKSSNKNPGGQRSAVLLGSVEQHLATEVYERRLILAIVTLLDEAAQLIRNLLAVNRHTLKSISLSEFAKQLWKKWVLLKKIPSSSTCLPPWKCALLILTQTKSNISAAI